MAFTGQLGTADSQYGQIELAEVGGGGTPTQSLEMRANILGVLEQDLQMRARITAVGEQSLQMRANIRGSQSLDMRASILGAGVQTIQLRANILGVTTQSLQMRANITPPAATIQMRARIRGSQSLQMRARLLAPVSTDLNVTFDAVEQLNQWLVVRYDVGDKEPNYKAIQMRAHILQKVEADLTVRYEVDYDGMPTDCIGRPKTRVYLRTVRQFQMRARIVN